MFEKTLKITMESSVIIMVFQGFLAEGGLEQWLASQNITFLKAWIAP